MVANWPIRYGVKLSTLNAQASGEPGIRGTRYQANQQASASALSGEPGGASTVVRSIGSSRL